MLRFFLVALHGLPCSATRENLNKTLVKNDNPKFSYRNNENYQMHHGRFSNKHVELVYTKYEVNRSIIEEDGCIQPFNRVFDMLTPGGFLLVFLLGVFLYFWISLQPRGGRLQIKSRCRCRIQRAPRYERLILFLKHDQIFKNRFLKSLVVF